MNETNLIKISHKIDTITYGDLNILYMNINSIRNKIEEIEHYLAINNNKIIHVIALTEIRILSECNKFFQLNNYNAYYNNRPSGDGGVAIFIHKTIQTCETANECIHNINFLCINMIDYGYNIAIIYKQPKTSNGIFLEYFNDKLAMLKKVIIIGDMNFDLLNEDNYESYANIAISNGFTILNKINRCHATRVAHKINSNETRTIIDHALTDMNEFKYTICLNDTPLSDHKQINISVNKKQKMKNQYACKTIEINYKKIDSEQYKHELNSINMNEIESFDQLYIALHTCKTNTTTIFIQQKNKSV